MAKKFKPSWRHLSDAIKRYEDAIFKCRQKFVKKIIAEVIKKEARKEALDIMTKCDEKYVNEFFMYYNKKSFNVVCMIIDSAKCKLIQDKKMKLKKTDHFGVVGDFYLSIKNKKWKIQK